MNFITGILNPKAAGAENSPERYLQLTSQCVRRMELMTSLGQGTPPKTNIYYAQCKYLTNKLSMAVHRAYCFLAIQFHSLSSEDLAKRLEFFKLLYALAEESDRFVNACCNYEFIKAAIMLTSASTEYVSSIGFRLELCTIIIPPHITKWGNPGILKLDTVASVHKAEVKNARDNFSLDNGMLLTKVRALIRSGKLHDDDSELATFLLMRLERLPGSIQSSLSEKDMRKLNLKEKLGSGGFSTVRKATWLGIEVAVKTFYGSDNPHFKKEVSIISKISHPNIISLIFYGVDNGECSIVMERMDEDLSALMRSRLGGDQTRSGPFCTLEALDIMLQVAEGVNYLHREKIMHRDLKSANVLVKLGKSKVLEGNESVQAKVADFGLSKTKERSSTFSQQTPNTGTSRWMAPEMIKSENDGSKLNHPYKSDVYSFGMVCYEILTGRIPFHKISRLSKVKEMVLGGDRPKLPDDCPKELRNLIEKCWNSEASGRPTFSAICSELKYLKSVQMTRADEDDVIKPSLLEGTNADSVCKGLSQSESCNIPLSIGQLSDSSMDPTSTFAFRANIVATRNMEGRFSGAFCTHNMAVSNTHCTSSTSSSLISRVGSSISRSLFSLRSFHACNMRNCLNPYTVKSVLQVLQNSSG